MKRLLFSTAILASVVAALFVAMRIGRSRSDTSSGRFEVVRVTRRSIGSTVKATGVVKLRVGAEVRVGSRVSGVVNRLHVMVGDTVTPGQLLAELDAAIAGRGHVLPFTSGNAPGSRSWSKRGEGLSDSCRR